MRLTELTTAELGRVARLVLRRYLDVTAGTQPAAALAPLVSKTAAGALGRLASDPARGEVRHRDLGAVALLRLGPDRAFATTAVARAGRPPEVVAVELGIEGERVVALRVGEADVRSQPLRHPDVPAVGPGQPLPAAPAHLESLLGDVPTDAATLERWIAAAAVIDTYRERYGVDDATSSFGATPSDPEQAQERARALAHVRELSAQMELVDPHERELGLEAHNEQELGG